jgi:hypothetical protein
MLSVVVTPEMRDAGAAVIIAGGWNPDVLAVLVYRAMRVLEPSILPIQPRR